MSPEGGHAHDPECQTHLICVTKHYYIFIPGATEVQPYTVFISSIDLAAELVCEYTLSISQQGEEYYVELVDETTRDVIMK